jgi:hypothetical protein
LRKTMILNIFSYYIIGDLLSKCSIKIPLFPKMTSPKLLLYFWEFFINFTSRYTFQNSYDSGNGILRRKRNQNVNIIFGNFTAVNFKIKMTRYLNEKFFNPWSYFLFEYLFSVFRAPDQMILSFINRMACCFQCHAVILIGKHPFLKSHGKSPMRHGKWILLRFSSPTKGRSIQALFS